MLPPEKERWDADLIVRLAVERLWITAGNVVEASRRSVGVDVGEDPWAELVGYRNRLAHALPGDLSTDRIWVDTTTDLPRILAHVRARRSSPGRHHLGRRIAAEAVARFRAAASG